MKRISILSLLLVLALSSYNCGQKKGDTGATSGDGKSSDLKVVYFDYDESMIRSDQLAVLKGNQALIKDKSATVEGHCDERGSNEYNLTLGQRRAQAVKNYYVNLGSDASKIKVISYGESKPVCSSSDESCWAKNRRGETRK